MAGYGSTRRRQWRMIPGELCDDSKMRLPRNRAPILGRRFQRHAMLLDKLVGAAVGSCNGSGSVSCGAFVNSATYSQFFIVPRSLRRLHQYLLHQERPCCGTRQSGQAERTASPTRPRDRISQPPRTSFRVASVGPPEKCTILALISHRHLRNPVRPIATR